MKSTKTKLLTLLATTVATIGVQAQTTPAPQPGICSRACWGASSSSCGTSLGSLTRAIIHHTASPSDFTSDYENAKARVRNVQNYHKSNNGWCDIGYHFMVSNGGHIFEGRVGSLGSSSGWKRGNHAGCGNNNSMGFTFLGYFHTPYNHSPSTAMQNAMYDVIAWRMPSGWSPYGGRTSYSGSLNGTGAPIDTHSWVGAYTGGGCAGTACPGSIIINNFITSNFHGGPMRTGVANRRTSAVNDAAPVSLSHPTSVTTGQSFSATVTMKNTGTTSWPDLGGYKLGSQNPQDNTRWGLSRVAVAGTVNPGQNYAFTFTATAPGSAGTYSFDWTMLQEGVQWFGGSAVGTIVVSTPSTGVIVDNTAATYVGSWSSGSAAADKYGADYRYRSTAAVSEPAIFTANIPAGSRNVYAWWPVGTNRSTTAPYIVYHSAGSTTVTKNQQTNGGSWQSLGNYNFNSGNNEVRLSCWTTTGYVVVADAVKFGD